MTDSIISPPRFVATIHGPTGTERLHCELADGLDRVKNLRPEWWRPLVVAYCRRNWGDGTLETHAPQEFTWRTR